MLAVFGQIVHWPAIVTLALFPVIVLTYVRLARKEEQEITRWFGADYEAYLQRVPMFFPRRARWGQFLNPLEWYGNPTVCQYACSSFLRRHQRSGIDGPRERRSSGSAALIQRSLIARPQRALLLTQQRA
ncbi:hypothetical protein ParKJ_22210 [Paraburkholderia fungorum]|uniref:Phospholipid methyltransferase n=1 Tax=Paraburkholderia fungorum TaxID=134537 RepID=A0AAP5QAI4_9BURK|nr:hypothetical protein [Paraburkholderia fungorum]MDT8840143.1 hypothetical protein [Paraburkholderia fungorum]